jgi:hypothetical protein
MKQDASDVGRREVVKTGRGDKKKQISNKKAISLPKPPTSWGRGPPSRLHVPSHGNRSIVFFILLDFIFLNLIHPQRLFDNFLLERDCGSTRNSSRERRRHALGGRERCTTCVGWWRDGDS